MGATHSGAQQGIAQGIDHVIHLIGADQAKRKSVSLSGMDNPLTGGHPNGVEMPYK